MIRKYGKYSETVKAKTKKKKTIGSMDAEKLNETQIRNTMLSKINKFRTENGVAPLKLQLEISSIADSRAGFMDLFGVNNHNIPFIGTPDETVRGCGIDFSNIGENLAIGPKTINKALKAWKASDGHRANILNSDYTHLAVGYYNHKWVLIFLTDPAYYCWNCGEDLLDEGELHENMEEMTEYTAHLSYNGMEESANITAYVCKYCKAICDVDRDDKELGKWEIKMGTVASPFDYMSWTDSDGNPIKFHWGRNTEDQTEQS